MLFRSKHHFSSRLNSPPFHITSVLSIIVLICRTSLLTRILFVSQILQTVAGGSRGIGYIYAGRVVAGVGIGAISAVAPAFVSECSPKEVRGRITGLFQIMVAVGVMLSYFINREYPSYVLLYFLSFPSTCRLMKLYPSFICVLISPSNGRPLPSFPC